MTVNNTLVSCQASGLHTLIESSSIRIEVNHSKVGETNLSAISMATITDRRTAPETVYTYFGNGTKSKSGPGEAIQTDDAWIDYDGQGLATFTYATNVFGAFMNIIATVQDATSGILVHGCPDEIQPEVNESGDVECDAQQDPITKSICYRDLVGTGSHEFTNNSVAVVALAQSMRIVDPAPYVEPATAVPPRAEIAQPFLAVVARAVEVVTVGGGLCGDGVTAASHVMRSFTIAQLDSCRGIELEPLGFLQSPTRLTFGATPQRFVFGASVGNIVVIGGFCVLHFCAVAIVARIAGRTLSDSMLSLRFPSWPLFATMILLHYSLAACILTVSRATSTFFAVWGSITSVLWVLGSALCCVATHRFVLSKWEANEDQKQSGIQWLIFATKGQWSRSLFSSVVDDFTATARYFVRVEFGMTIVSGGLQAAAAVGGSTCAVTMTVLGVMHIGYFLLLVVIRPFSRLTNQLIFTVNALVQCTGAVASAVFYLVDDAEEQPRGHVAAVQICAVVSMLLLVLRGCINAGRTVFLIATYGWGALRATPVRKSLPVCEGPRGPPTTHENSGDFTTELDDLFIVQTVAQPRSESPACEGYAEVPLHSIASQPPALEAVLLTTELGAATTHSGCPCDEGEPLYDARNAVAAALHSNDVALVTGDEESAEIERLESLALLHLQEEEALELLFGADNANPFERGFEEDIIEAQPRFAADSHPRNSLCIVTEAATPELPLGELIDSVDANHDPLPDLL